MTTIQAACLIAAILTARRGWLAQCVVGLAALIKAPREDTADVVRALFGRDTGTPKASPGIAGSHPPGAGPQDAPARSINGPYNGLTADY